MFALVLRATHPGADHHIKILFDRHNALDQKIKNMESHLEPGTHEEIETQKKEKLLLKDQLYVILQRASLAAD